MGRSRRRRPVAWKNSVACGGSYTYKGDFAAALHAYGVSIRVVLINKFNVHLMNTGVNRHVVVS